MPHLSADDRMQEREVHKKEGKGGEKRQSGLLRDAERRAELDGETELISSEALY